MNWHDAITRAQVWVKRRWGAAWRLIGGVSLRVKIVGIGLLMIALLSSVLTWQVRSMTRRILTHESDQRGISIAESLADHGAKAILEGEVQEVGQLAQDAVTRNEDVVYVFAVDASGRLLTGSFDRGIPADLLDANDVAPGQPYHLATLQVGEELVRDVAVPVSEGRFPVVRVGISLARLQAILVDVTRRILLTTLLVSLLGVLIITGLTWLLTRPLLGLADAIRHVADGDLAQRLSPWAQDEIGQSQESFNVMVERLDRFREEMEASNDRLIRRNKELSTLYAIAKAVSGPLGLSEVLDRALRQAMALVGTGGGWVCLLGEEGSCEVCVAAGTASQVDLGRGYCVGCTYCQDVARARQPMIAASLPPDCPLRAARGASTHAIVPLLVRGRTVGLLNLICERERCLDDEDLDLLMGLGQQLGVAVENARLWEELRRKEVLRGELLRKLITAQEEERQRISRELHDEAGQALTSLLVGLRALDKATATPQVHSLVADLRDVATQTLDELHNLALELRPSALDDLGLVPALARYVQNAPVRFGFEADFVTTGIGNQRLPPEVEITLYRIVQEALTNVARHAEASHASVLLQQRDGSVVLVVEDNGSGFDVEKVMASSEERERLGLYGIEERASLAGGRFTLESRPGAGTTLSVEIPLEGVWSTREDTRGPEKAHLSAS